jgi:hypothetical protein
LPEVETSRETEAVAGSETNGMPDERAAWRSFGGTEGEIQRAAGIAVFEAVGDGREVDVSVGEGVIPNPSGWNGVSVGIPAGEAVSVDRVEGPKTRPPSGTHETRKTIKQKKQTKVRLDILSKKHHDDYRPARF